MKYKDSDIILIKTNKIHKFKDFLPHKGIYMYLKIINNGKILVNKGNMVTKIFNIKSIENKNLQDMKLEFFYDYIYNLSEKVKQDNCAYQFNFQYKDNIIPYTCSIYPCLVYDECKSLDIIVRKSTNDSIRDDFFTML